MHNIKIFMVIRDVSQRKELFENVVKQASQISKNFYIVNHLSIDDTKQILEKLEKKLNLNLEIIYETLDGTMDDVKAKHYRLLKEKYGNDKNNKQYIFILDRDEVLDDKLISEINKLDSNHDVFMINRHTYLINQPIDRNAYLPLFFEVNSVEINTFSKFHNLYKIHSNDKIKLNGILHHYSYVDIKNLLNKNIYYARGEADDLYQNNANISNLKIFFKFLFEGTIYFLYTLFYHFNFLTLEGWLYSFNGYLYKFYKYLFYLELKLKKKAGNFDK